jgi:hypothetical protein
MAISSRSWGLWSISRRKVIRSRVGKKDGFVQGWKIFKRQDVGFLCIGLLERCKNQSSGGDFINSWFKGEKILVELKAEIKDGNLEWIDKIMYYSQRVRGSPAYWRAKRAEVYMWINYHVDAGNIALNVFITLSCAEYYWKDVRRLIKDQYEAAGLVVPDLNESWGGNCQ